MRGSEDSGYDVFFMKIKGLKEGEKVYIEQVVPTDEEDSEGKKVYKELEKIFDISGSLEKVEVQDREWKGDQIRTAKLHLFDHDAQERYILDFNTTFVGRSLINSLAGLPSFENVKISVRNHKDGFQRVYVSNNGEKSDWAFSYDELLAKSDVSEVKEKGKVVKKRDWFECNNFLLDEILLKQISDRLVAQKPNTKASVSATKAGYADFEEEEVEDDLPF